MDEQRVREYLRVVQELLGCPAGEEPEVLERNREWVDGGLVAVMGQVVEQLRQSQGEANIVQFLERIAQQIQRLENARNSLITEEMMEFLIQLLTAVEKNPINSQPLYSLLQKNIDKVNMSLANTLTSWAKYNLPHLSRDTRYQVSVIILNFSNAIQEFPLRKSIALEIAISGYEVISDFFTPQNFLQEYVYLSMGKGNAFFSRKLGNISENIKTAIESYKSVLFLYSHYDMDPQAWSAAIMGLANSYYNKPLDNKRKNIKISRLLYQKALAARSKEKSLLDWVNTMMNLGTAYANSLDGDILQNREESIRLYHQAREALSKKGNPTEWSRLTVNLAIIYRRRLSGDLSQNIEKSIALYQEVLEIRTEFDSPIEWANTMDNLGTSYCYRLCGDRSENIKDAISAYKNALRIRTKYDMPVQWSMTTMNLASAYRAKPDGDRLENIRNSIYWYEQSLQVRTKSEMPIEWAEATIGLGNAYYTIRDQDPGFLEVSIQLYEDAFSVIDKSLMPVKWAKFSMNLATAYIARTSIHKSYNIEKSLLIYQEILDLLDENSVSTEYLHLLNNIATAYTDAYNNNNEKVNLLKAINFYKKALHYLSPVNFSSDCRRTARNLANLYADNHRWTEALEPYNTALQAAETLYSASLFRSSQEAQLKETDDLYRRAAYAHAKTGNLPRALELIEQGRARGLSETLQRDRANLDQIQQQNPDLVKRYRTAADTLRNLEAIERDPNPTQTNRDQLRHLATRARADLNTCLTEIRQIPGYETFLTLPTFADLTQSLPITHPLLYLLVTPTGSAALLLHPSPLGRGAGGEGILWLDELTEEKVQEMADTWLKADQNNKSAYFAYHQTPTPATKAVLLQAQTTWHQTIDTTTRQLWDLAIGPVTEYLREQWLRLRSATSPDRGLSEVEGPVSEVEGPVSEVEGPASKAEGPAATLIPTSYLSLLPLHAAWTDLPSPNGREAGGEGQRRYALDTCTYTYAPNTRSLTQPQPIEPTADTLLAISNPTQDLHHASLEIQNALSHFPPGSWQLLQTTKATRQATLTAIPHHTILHFSCHGTAELRDPLNSGLLMADELLLTLRDFFSLQLQKPRLAILSACETSLPGLDLPDEVISLPVGLLQAGVPAIIASLWSVSDHSTMLLLTRFYELWRTDNLPPAQALRQAQLWLRDQPDYAHPYHWAAFTYTGV